MGDRNAVEDTENLGCVLKVFELWGILLKSPF